MNFRNGRSRKEGIDKGEMAAHGGERASMPVPYSDTGALITKETRDEDEGQVFGSTHSAIMLLKPGNAG